MTGLENHGIKKRFPNTLDQSGAIAVIMCAALIMFAGFAALAIDIGHLAWVQSELKKAAEAGALAGARTLVPYIAGNPPQPNWSGFKAVAINTVKANYADGNQLTDCTVQSGYWSVVQRLFFTTAPAETLPPVPGIQVVVAKNSGQNNGPLQWLFAPVLGFSPTKDLSATSVATVAFPAAMPKGSVFPLAVTKAIVDQYWNQPIMVPFDIGSGSSNGQWTSFLVNSSGASYVKGLITDGNPTPLTAGETIYIQTGVVASNYGNVPVTTPPTTVVIPFVDSVASGSTPTIKGFVAFDIKSSVQGTKIITGLINKTYPISQATGFSSSGYSPANHAVLVN
ncbi:MAG: TadG family pilus assembly protein [Deltaproteobacteria bacterium]|nr:TadG family pilus assembly protein [Deltaproteobacteria bacterium]